MFRPLPFAARQGKRGAVDVGVGDVAQHVSTGDLPSWSEVEELVHVAHRRCYPVEGGVVADYIPALAQADPRWFTISVARVDGEVHAAGDVEVEFTIQSISKAFVYALVCEEYGRELMRERIGVNNTGLPFNSVIAIEFNRGHPTNPMVNAGAIATTALAPGRTPADQWDTVRAGLSEFAGRPLQMDEVVYQSESETNQRNRAIARLLESYGRIRLDPLTAVDIYTKQCALRVTATDLAIMAATLAAGGVNPITGRKVVSAGVCRDTLAILTANGAYERSGEWLFDIGLPGKSGVSGGIMTVAPGKAGIGVFSPTLDEAGNSVRGQRATAYLSRVLGLNIFASAASARALGRR
jgi:glutaminase